MLNKRDYIISYLIYNIVHQVYIYLYIFTRTYIYDGGLMTNLMAYIRIYRGPHWGPRQLNNH